MESENLTQFYGVDWFGMAATFLSLWWLGDKRWYGFAVGMIAATFWFMFGYLTGSVPAMVLNVSIFVLSARGLYLWTKTAK